MQVLINQKPSAKFTAKDEKHIRLAVKKYPIVGSVMTGAAATAAFTRRMNWLFGTLFVFSVIAIPGIALLADANDVWLIWPLAAIILTLLLAFMLFMHRRRTKAWNTRLESRIQSLVDAGSEVRLDETSLELAGRRFAWAALKIETVELVDASGDDSRSYVIERLLLTSMGQSIVLDSALMDNGRLIVDNAYNRLARVRA